MAEHQEQVTAAETFCEVIEAALIDRASQGDGTMIGLWIVEVILHRNRADADLTPLPSGETIQLRFDVMDADIEPVTLRPFATDIAKILAPTTASK